MSYEDAVELIKKRAHEAGISQTELARRSNLSDAQVSRILKFASTASQEALAGLAEAVGYPRENILRMSKILPSKPDSDMWVDEQVFKLRKIPPELRPLADRIISSLSDAEEREKEQSAVRRIKDAKI